MKKITLTETRDEKGYYVGFRIPQSQEIQGLRRKLSKHIVNGITIYCRNFQTADKIGNDYKAQTGEPT